MGNPLFRENFGDSVYLHLLYSRLRGGLSTGLPQSLTVFPFQAQVRANTP